MRVQTIRRRIPAAAGALALAVCLCAGCGGGSEESAQGDVASGQESSASAGGDIDPCALVTAAEAETVLEGPVGAGERPKEANFPPRLVTCRYVAKRGDRVAVMTVMVRRGDTDSEARIGFTQSKEQFPGAEAVSGLGQDAFWIGNQLNVLQGRDYLNIGGDFDRATAQQLAATALRRF